MLARRAGRRGTIFFLDAWAAALQARCLSQSVRALRPLWGRRPRLVLELVRIKGSGPTGLKDIGKLWPQPSQAPRNAEIVEKAQPIGDMQSTLHDCEVLLRE